MAQIKSQDELLDSFIDTAENLSETLDELLRVMGSQKEALVTSNIEQVEELTELHSQLSVTYHKQEEKFVNLLRNILDNGNEEIRVTGLTSIFPDSAKIIKTWRETLLEKTRLLQEKQKHIKDLLDFVMSRNSSMMKTIYSLHNEKNTHYSVTGHKESVVSGIKINQKA